MTSLVILLYTSKTIKSEQVISFDAWYKMAITPGVKQDKLKREEKMTWGVVYRVINSS